MMKVFLAARPLLIGSFGTGNNGVMMLGMAASVTLVIMIWWPPCGDSWVAVAVVMVVPTKHLYT